MCVNVARPVRVALPDPAASRSVPKVEHGSPNLPGWGFDSLGRHVICRRCNNDKSDEEFSWKVKVRGIRQTICKTCQKSYAAEHYLANKDQYKARTKRSNPALRQKNKEYMLDHLRCHPCADCGEDDIEVLQFDHVSLRRGGKTVTQMMSSRKKLIEEIAKCEVRCANCHVRRTRRQFGWERTI